MTEMLSTFMVILLLYLTNLSLQSNESELVKKLQTISRFVRPVVNQSNTVNVKFGYELIHIVSVDEKKQLVTQKVWLRMNWVNDLMKWNPVDYGGVGKDLVCFFLL